MDNQFESVCDFAISKFKESCHENDESDMNLLEVYNFPHWKEIMQKIQSVWNKNYSDKLQIYNDEKDLDNHFIKFRNDICRIISKRNEYQTLKKYFDHVIDYKINEIRESSSEDNQKENQNGDMTTNESVNLGKRKSILNKKTNAVSRKDLFKKIYQFEILHLIRAHSRDSSINDNTTQVNDVCFEIAPNTIFGDIYTMPIYTNLYATCGHNIINIIDSETGKIIKRFNDDVLMNKTKDSFNCIAWTILNSSTSALIAAGAHGQIKVIIPKFSSCMMRIDAHSGPITSLLIHYKYPNILLSGSDDHIIKIWKINLKEASSDLDSECTNELICTINFNSSSKKKEFVYSMCFLPNNYLLIATSHGIYSIDLSDDILFNTTTSKEIKENSIENLAPEDAITFMTTKPVEKGNILEAKQVKIMGLSANNEPFEDFIISNKLIFHENLIFANLIDSNYVYIMEVMRNPVNHEELLFKIVSSFKIGEEKSSANTKISIFKDDMTTYLIKSSHDGCFYVASFHENLLNYSTLLRYLIPSDYTIKPYSDPAKKTNMKNYGLLERSTVVNAVCNGSTIVSVTNQNMIVTWKKIGLLSEEY